jgi:hypothetical protein
MKTNEVQSGCFKPIAGALLLLIVGLTGLGLSVAAVVMA